MAQTAQGGPLIAAFAGLLEGEHSSENLDAIRAFDDFKAAPLASKAQAIWSTFSAPNSPRQVKPHWPGVQRHRECARQGLNEPRVLDDLAGSKFIRAIRQAA